MFAHRNLFVYRVSRFDENYLVPIRRTINDYLNYGTYTLKHLELRTLRCPFESKRVFPLVSRISRQCRSCIR